VENEAARTEERTGRRIRRRRELFALFISRVAYLRHHSCFSRYICDSPSRELGITTDKLSDKIYSHYTATQRTLDRAQKQGLIERVKGEPPAPGQFSPVYNIITDRGKPLLQNHHQPFY
jgi:hypothetical protein